MLRERRVCSFKLEKCSSLNLSLEAQGGALVNLIHSYTDNGDPFIRTFTDQLLEEVRPLDRHWFANLILYQVSRPFFSTLHKWLFFGELYDPFIEFFVAVDSGYVGSRRPLSGTADHLSGDGGFDRFATEGEEYPGTREDGLKLWETKYRFRQEMLPLFVGNAFGKKVVLVNHHDTHFSNSSRFSQPGEV